MSQTPKEFREEAAVMSETSHLNPEGKISSFLGTAEIHVLRGAFAEFLGVFVLVFVGCAAQISTGDIFATALTVSLFFQSSSPSQPVSYLLITIRCAFLAIPSFLRFVARFL